VTIRAVWLPSLELALANLFYSLAHIRFQPGIVQEAQGRSAETAVSIYSLQIVKAFIF
jgi:hypothetical protein